MAIIYSYPTVEPKLIDKILITQSYNEDDEEPIEGNPTRSVEISSIGQLFGTTGTANTIPMFSTTGFKDSPISSAITGSGTNMIKASNVDRFVIDKPSGITAGDPEYLISQDDVWKASFGWDDDGGGFGYLYNWSGGGWRFGAAGNNPAMTISTVAGSEGVTIENELAVPKINFGFNTYYGRDMTISGIGDGTFDGVQVTNEFVIAKEVNTTGDIAMYFKYGDERVGGIYLDDDASQHGLAFYVQESATNANIVKKISLTEPVTIGSALASTLPPANGLAVQGGITAASISATNGTFANQLQVEGDARITGALVDSSANAGTAGQVLSSTVTGTAWIPNNAAATYSIGDFAHGGIVFWVDETGQHGLVCVKEDQSSGVRWYAGTYGNTRAKGDGVYSGKANTVIIIAAQVAIGDDGNTYAARICNELQITESGITYGDWYLPSKFELNLMSTNKATINTTASANGGSNFSTGAYWCSTEIDNSEAWVQAVSNGVQLNQDKNNTFYVRAVRAF